MCGIIGCFYGPEQAESALREHIVALRHRGPDSHHVEAGDGYALGHTLLSIIGSSPIRQPIRSQDGNVVLTFNGEIYNYRELMAGDPALRARCSGTSDTEVLVEGLSLYGIDFVERLNGMFAFGAFDRRTSKAYLVRDRLGVKPLYYIQKDQAVYFASEARPLTQLAGITPERDVEAYYSYTRFRYPIGERTFYKGVKMLPPGTILTVAGDSLARRTYWDIEEPKAFEGSYLEAREQARDLFLDSVRIQMRSDHSFCTYLSGGLDSSYLTALAKQTKDELDTYSIGIPVDRFDESIYSTQVADALGTRHHAYTLETEEYRQEHASFVRHLDAPVGVPNQVALKVLSRELARDHRCVLSGEGADEVFGGYGRIFLLPGDWEMLEAARQGEGSAAMRVLEKIQQAYGRTEFADYPSFFLRRYGYLTHDEAVAALRPFFLDADLEAAREAVEGEIRALFDRWHGDLYTRQLLLFQKIHLPGLLLRLDTATMAHSVEGRVPFLDHRLVEFLNSLPIHYKMKRKDSFAAASLQGLLSDELSEHHDIPKAPLKEMAEQVLPKEIVWRKKVGFPIPASYYQVADAREEVPSYVVWVQRNLELVLG